MADGVDLERITQQAINNIWEKKVEAGEVDADTWKHNVEQLWNGIQEGAGDSIIDVEYTDTRYELMMELKTNIHVFATFKNHSEINLIVDALVDGSGKQRSFNEFKEIASQISIEYNENWLATEYNTAVSSSQMAVKWQDFQKNKDILPRLQYYTQGDDRVSLEHAKLNGVTLLIDDPFWDKYFPPNRFGCRCGARQVASIKDIRPTELPSEAEAPTYFQHNVGKTKDVFTPQHPFFLSVSDGQQRERLVKATSHLIYNNYGEEYQKAHFNESTSGFLVIHKDGKSHHIKRLTEVGKTLADTGESVEILPPRPGKASPNILRNGQLWHLVSSSGSKTSVQQRIRSGSKQAARILLQLTDEFKARDLISGMSSAINKDGGQVKEIDVLLPDGTLVNLKREDIENRNFKSLIK